MALSLVLELTSDLCQFRVEEQQQRVGKVGVQLQDLVGWGETAVDVVGKADEVLVSRVLGTVLDDDRVGGWLASLPVAHRLSHIHHQQWVPGIVVQWHRDHRLHCSVRVDVYGHHLENIHYTCHQIIH